MTGSAVSILTPTYNRAQVLHRVYDSLNRQNTRDFDWVVVDDGSTDDTPALLAQWQSEADFPITWFRYSNNRGKHAAINAGSKHLSGDYTLMLDSDDALVDDAMEIIATWRTTTGIDTMPNICGLAFRCVDELGRVVGKLKSGEQNLSSDTVLMSTRAARYGLGIDFEIVLVCKTRVFSARSFGELNSSENFPPSIDLNRISEFYNVIFVDRPIRIYYRHDGILRLSDTPSNLVKWPRGRYLRALATLNEDIDYLWQRPKVFLNAARRVTRLGLHIGRSPHLQFRDLAHGRSRLLWAMSIPGGYIGYLRDRLRRRVAPKADSDLYSWGPAAPPEDPVLHPPPKRFHQTIRTAALRSDIS